MKLVCVKNLQCNEVLARSIYSDSGKVLLSAGVKITREYVFELISNGVYWAYIEDSNFDDVTDDKYLNELKMTTIECMPNIFDDILNHNKTGFEKVYGKVKSLLNYIIEQGNVNINLYEVKTYDDYTYIHCVDTCIMSVYLGILLKLKNDSLTDLGMSAILHDIGKAKIPKEIINKKGTLTVEEFEIIKKHPLLGKEILEDTDFLNCAIIEGVAQHHERYDGKGYPFGYKNDEIALFARIIALCDVFTAVSANRSYRERYKPTEAYEYILGGSGTFFDDKIVETFRNNFAVYPLGSCVRLSNGIEGYVVRQSPHFADRPVIRVVYEGKSKNIIQPYEINLLNSTNLVIESLIL